MAEDRETSATIAAGYVAPPPNPMWLWVVSAWGVFVHSMQFLLVVSPRERPILTGQVQPEVVEDAGMSLAQMLVRGGTFVDTWFLNSIAVVAILSVISMVLLFMRRTVGLYAYTVLTLTMVGLTIAQGIFTIAWLMFPMLITVVGVLNRDQLK